MFQLDPNDKRRVRIVDISHLCYRYAFSPAPELSVTIWLDNQLTTVSTKVPALVTKSIFRWSCSGAFPTLIAFDSAGSLKYRKAYFNNKAQEQGNVALAGYKGGRSAQNDNFYRSINITRQVLMNGGVNCVALDGYEADDIIKAAVDRAKIDYPHLPIDVFTGDADLLPLVDEQVSVWYYSKKGTYAEPGVTEIKSYVQVTPRNYQHILEGLTACKGLKVPYNTLLLTKLLRGDKSDEVPAFPKFTPTLYNTLISNMESDGVDIANLFRYDRPIRTYVDRATMQPIAPEVAAQLPKERLLSTYQDAPTLTAMLDVLKNYLNDAQLAHIRTVYNGINLNGAFFGLQGFERNPITFTTPIRGFDEMQMRKAAYEPFKINLPAL